MSIMGAAAPFSPTPVCLTTGLRRTDRQPALSSEELGEAAWAYSEALGLWH